MSAKSEKVLRAEMLISWVLAIGVGLSGGIAGVGLVSRLLDLGTPSAQSSQSLIGELMSGGEIPGLHPVAAPGELLRGTLHWQPDILITLGLLLLIALPILRVAMTVIIFLHERDWPFVGITLVVLTVLLSGIFLGRAL
jgi:uncharacterized membrane protein